MNSITMDLEIQRKVDEDNEEWIFSYIMPFCENITQVSVKKEDVKEAMILWSNWKNGRIKITPDENEPMPEELRKLLIKEVKIIRCPKCGRPRPIAAYINSIDGIAIYRCSDPLCDFAWSFKEDRDEGIRND